MAETLESSAESEQRLTLTENLKAFENKRPLGTRFNAGSYEDARMEEIELASHGAELDEDKAEDLYPTVETNKALAAMSAKEQMAFSRQFIETFDDARSTSATAADSRREVAAVMNQSADDLGEQGVFLWPLKARQYREDKLTVLEVWARTTEGEEYPLFSVAGPDKFVAAYGSGLGIEKWEKSSRRGADTVAYRQAG